MNSPVSKIAYHYLSYAYCYKSGKVSTHTRWPINLFVDSVSVSVSVGILPKNPDVRRINGRGGVLAIDGRPALYELSF